MGRVAEITRAALASFAELVELAVPPTAPAAEFSAALASHRARVDCIFDLSTLIRTGRLAPELPLLVWALGNLPRGAGLLSGRRSQLKTSDTVLVNCRADATILERTLHGTGPVARLQPFAVDSDRFRPLEPPARAAARRELGLRPEQVAVIYSGRLNVQKQVHAALRLLAAARLREPRLVLLLAGEEDTIPFPEFAIDNRGYRESLERSIGELGLGASVRFLGRLGDADLARALAASDLFLSLTLHHDENFGFAPVEAMSCGLPALVSDWGGYRDSVAHGVSGYRLPTLFTEHGVRVAWRRGLSPLLALAAEPALRHRLGQAARERAERLYSLPAFARGLAVAVADAAARRGLPSRFGDEAFRFHPLARKLQARNALQHLAREKAGQRFDLTITPDLYPVYRFFVSPYASADVSDIEAEPGDRPDLLVPVAAQGEALESADPIWPERHPLGVATARAVATLDGAASLAELARQNTLPLPALLADATRLARRGVIDLGRAHSLAAELAQAAPTE